MPDPYFKGDGVELYLGDMREVLPTLDIAPAACVADLVLADETPPSPRGAERTCSNCGAGAAPFRRGWCSGCYQRWYKAGQPESGPPAIQNDSLEKWRQVPEVQAGREPTDLDVGTAGEHLVCADLLLGGFNAFRTDQNCAYDVAVDLGGHLIRLQVKSTRTSKAIPQREASIPAYQWHVRRAGKGGRRKYAEGEFDLLGLVGLDIRQVAYVPPSLKRTLIQIRPPGSTSGKQFSDYPFTRALHEIGEAT